jgi:hypothetical protein
VHIGVRGFVKAVTRDNTNVDFPIEKPPIIEEEKVND